MSVGNLYQKFRGGSKHKYIKCTTCCDPYQSMMIHSVFSSLRCLTFSMISARKLLFLNRDLLSCQSFIMSDSENNWKLVFCFCDLLTQVNQKRFKFLVGYQTRTYQSMSKWQFKKQVCIF